MRRGPARRAGSSTRWRQSCSASPRRVSRDRAPMWLEAVRAPTASSRRCRSSPMPRACRESTGPRCSNGAATVAATVEARASAVHLALADAICRVAEVERARSGAAIVGLTGGVFQNRLLAELAAAGLERRGFRVLLPERIPCNDGGLELRPGRRVPGAPGRPASRIDRQWTASPRRIHCADALVRTPLPERPAPRIRGRDAFRRGRRGRGDALAAGRARASSTCTCRSARCCARSARSIACATTSRRRRATSRRCAARSASITRPASASATCTWAAARRP